MDTHPVNPTANLAIRPKAHTAGRRAVRAALAFGVSGLAATLTATSFAGASLPHAKAHVAKVPLVVYAAEGYDQAEVTAFQKATGIPTSLYDDHTGIVLAKIEAERSNPKWGLVWLDGDQALHTLDQQGLLLRSWTPTVTYTSKGQSMVPADLSYHPTGFTVGGAIFYNTKVVSSAPRTWQDLLSARYKGQVGILNPAIDGPAYPSFAGLMQQLGGVKQGETYLTKLKANGAQLFTDPHVELAALESGQIGVMIGQSTYGIGAGMKLSFIKGVYPHVVTPVPSVIAIDAKAPAAEQAEAKQFINFVFTAAGQHVMKTGDPTGDSLYWPIIKGEAQPAQLPAVASLPLQVLNPVVWGPREKSVNAWFSAHIAL